jgi:hypothetical protein
MASARTAVRVQHLKAKGVLRHSTVKQLIGAGEVTGKAHDDSDSASHEIYSFGRLTIVQRMAPPIIKIAAIAGCRLQASGQIKPAMMLMVTARMITLKRKATTPWARTSRRKP